MHESNENWTYHHANETTAVAVLLLSIAQHNVHELVVSTQCARHLSILVQVKGDLLIEI